MTGPEHYLMAEALLRSCQLGSPSDFDGSGHMTEQYPAVPDDVEPEGMPVDSTAAALAAAHVHATLSVAAATARAAGVDGSTSIAWQAATSS